MCQQIVKSNLILFYLKYIIYSNIFVHLLEKCVTSIQETLKQLDQFPIEAACHSVNYGNPYLTSEHILAKHKLCM